MSLVDAVVLALEVLGLLLVAAGVGALVAWWLAAAGGPAWAGLGVSGLVVLVGAWWASKGR